MYLKNKSGKSLQQKRPPLRFRDPILKPFAASFPALECFGQTSFSKPFRNPEATLASNVTPLGDFLNVSDDCGNTFALHLNDFKAVFDTLYAKGNTTLLKYNDNDYV